MEKTLRVLGGGEDEGHSHSHSHAEPSSSVSADSGHASAVHVSPSANGLKSRKGENTKTGGEEPSSGEESHSDIKGPSKLSAYLNLFGDFVHNMYVYFQPLECQHVPSVLIPWMTEFQEQMALRTSTRHFALNWTVVN